MSARPIRSRSDFELPGGVTWLNTAHQGALPREALAAAERAVEWKRDPSKLNDDHFFAVPDRLRTVLAEVLGVSSDEVVLGNSASYGLHLMATGLDWDERDEILLVRDDFPATVTPWLPLESRGVRIRYLPERASLTPEAVAQALGPRTRLFCTTWVDSFSGHTLDPEAMGRICADAGVLFVLNATQGLGARSLDVSCLPVDALTCSGYKWLCGPYGTGFSWIRRDLLASLQPSRHYWLPSVRESGLEAMGGRIASSPPTGPARHDVFCTASFFNHLPWIAALEYLGHVGLDAAEDHNVRLVAAARSVVEDLGHRIVEPEGSEPSPFLVFEPAPHAPPVVMERLRASGCYVSLRSGRLRVSPHVHNELEDITRFGEALA